jgi:membrane-associated phospholipid phosphatase
MHSGGVATERPALVPRHLIWPVAIVAAVCAAGVATLGLVFGHDRTGSAFDQKVYWAVYKGFVGERGVLRAMLTPTEPVLLIVVIMLVVMLAVARRRPRLAVLAVAGPLAAVLLNSAVLKPLFGRTINNGSLAFPSGHTAGLVAVLTVLIIAVISGVRPPWRKSVTSLVIVGASVITGVGSTALIGMKYHYVTDTFGGFGVAVATVLGLALAIDQVTLKRARMTALRNETATSGVAL